MNTSPRRTSYPILSCTTPHKEFPFTYVCLARTQEIAHGIILENMAVAEFGDYLQGCTRFGVTTKVYLYSTGELYGDGSFTENIIW